MITKYTPWETRNLGVLSSVEFYVGLDDSWADISGELLAHQEAYQVMHIAGGNTDVLYNAPQCGFFPVEMNIQLSRKLDGIELPSIYRRFEPAISCTIANAQERAFILDRIREGSIFSTDKVARDPYFGNEFAGRRYAFWTQDVLDQGADLLCMKYKDRIAVFNVCVHRSDTVAEAFLGGVMPEFHNSGLGFMGAYFIIKHAMEKGFKRIVTGVSSNNIPVFKLLEMFGYEVDRMSYCLIKHL